VLTNCTDPDGDPLTLVNWTQTNCTAGIVGTNLVITTLGTASTNSVFCGYTISDGFGGSNNGIVSITVTNLGTPVALIPSMSNNTSPFGVASANTNSSTAFNAFNGVGFNASSSASSFNYSVEWYSPTNHVVTSWVVSTPNWANTPGAQLQGSTDGVNWTNLIAPELDSGTYTITNAPAENYYQVIWFGGNFSAINQATWQIYGY
jgi:hypothetical protein